MNANRDDEQRLMKRAAEGDLDAYGQLIDRLQQPVFHFVHRQLGSAEDAEDATQETFFRAWRAIGRFDSRFAVKTWFFTIARNVAIDVLRKRPRRTYSLDEPLRDEEGNENTRDAPDETESARDRLRGKRLEEALAAAVDQLPSKLAAVFHLRHREELKLDEIARTMKISVSDAKVSLHRARARLKELLKAWLEP